MAKLLKLRRGTTSQHSSFTGAEGEVTIDTTKDTAVVHDGSTAGGRPLLREDLDNMPASGVSAGTYGSSTALPVITVNAEGLVTSATTSAIDSTAIANGTSSASVANNGDITVNRAGTDRLIVDQHGVQVGGRLDVSSNIQVAGTVDGRDVAADGSKLDNIEAGATADQNATEIRSLVASANDSNVFTDADHSKLNGIESGATADQTATEILNAIKTVDGSGSGLDADLLDGESSAYYRNASNLNAGTISASRLPPINSVPSGAILIWSGASNAIPSGYVLCNGSNSTPDLRSNFVVGAGGSYSVGATGGSNSTTLGTSNLPAHSHSTGNHSHGVNDHTHTTPNHSHGVNSHSHSTPNHNHNMNAHSHNGNTSNNGAHSHNGSTIYNRSGCQRNCQNNPTASTGSANAINFTTSNNGNHNHSFGTSNAASNTNTSGSGNTGNTGANTNNSGSGTSGAAGANTTAVSAGTTGATGSGSSFDNRPPFYALCYIMKT